MDKNFKLDFVGIGPQKTGSTWLHFMLVQHPDLCLPIATKEIQFFDEFYDKDLKNLTTYFKHQKGGQLTGEVTPKYFDTAASPERIKQHFPNIKILVSLRNPIEKAQSLYRHYLKLGLIKNIDFNKAIKEEPQILSSGNYKSHIEHWHSLFSPEQFHYVLMDDIKDDPEEVLKGIESFLGIKEYIPEDLREKKNAATMPSSLFVARYMNMFIATLKRLKLHKIVEVGKSFGVRKMLYESKKKPPAIPEEWKPKLLEIYENDTQYIENLLGKKLDAWRKI
ncbi:MAG: hypothetical protein ACI94Y_001200 [Maribacter sp.]